MSARDIVDSGERAPDAAKPRYALDFALVIGAALVAAGLSYGLKDRLASDHWAFLAPAALMAFVTIRGAMLFAAVVYNTVFAWMRQGWLAGVICVLAGLFAVAAAAFVGLSLPGTQYWFGRLFDAV